MATTGVLSRVLVAGLAASAFALTSSAQQPASGPGQPSGAAQGAAGGQEPRPTFRAGTDLVVVDVYPQRDGRIVEGLTAQDFEVLEDGKPQAIEAFEFVRRDVAAAERDRRDPDGLNEMYAMAADPRRRVFVIYLDRLHTRIEGSSAVRSTLANALDRLIGDDDLFAVMTPDMRPRDLTFGRKTVSIAEQLQRVWTWGTRGEDRRDLNDPVEYGLWACFHYRMEPPDGRIVEWLVPDGAERRFLDELLVERRREDRVLTNLDALIAHLGSLREARTVLLTLTDGWRQFDREPSLLREPEKDIRASGGNLANPTFQGLRGGPSLDSGDNFAACIAELQRLAELDNTRRFRDLMTAANRANVSFYPLAASGLAALDGGAGAQRMIPNSDAPNQSVLAGQFTRVADRVRALREIAENTDGIAVVNTNDTASGFTRIIDDVSSYYLLGYRSTDERRDRRFRRIEVRATPAGLNVRARRGYVADRTDVRNASGVDGAPSAASAVPAEVEAALGALAGVRESAELFGRGVVRNDSAVITLELSSAQLASGTWRTGGDVQVELRTARGERVGVAETRWPAGARSTIVTVPAPGVSPPLRARVVVTSGRTSLDDAVEISAVPAGTRLLAPPSLYRATPSPRSPLRPVADPRFRRAERIRVEWPLTSPLTGSSVRLLDRRGNPLNLGATAAVQDSTAGGQVLAADLNLAPLAEGEYVLEVTATDTAGDERHVVAFRVVR